jgi:hypothetical protein
MKYVQVLGAGAVFLGLLGGAVFISSPMMSQKSNDVGYPTIASSGDKL